VKNLELILEVEIMISLFSGVCLSYQVPIAIGSSGERGKTGKIRMRTSSVHLLRSYNESKIGFVVQVRD